MYFFFKKWEGKKAVLLLGGGREQHSLVLPSPKKKMDKLKQLIKPEEVPDHGSPPPLRKTFGADLLKTASENAFDTVLFNYLCHVAEKELDEWAEDGYADCCVNVPDELDTLSTNFHAAVMAKALNKRYLPVGVFAFADCYIDQDVLGTPKKWRFLFSVASCVSEGGRILGFGPVMKPPQGSGAQQGTKAD
jgi:hypothetical protein